MDSVARFGPYSAGLTTITPIVALPTVWTTLLDYRGKSINTGALREAQYTNTHIHTHIHNLTITKQF